jgi:hypothetical protein
MIEYICFNDKLDHVYNEFRWDKPKNHMVRTNLMAGDLNTREAMANSPRLLFNLRTKEER